MKFYLLGEGPYNELQWIAIFPTLEKAEDESARREGSSFWIHGIEFDPELTSIPEEYEKGPTYHIEIRFEDRSLRRFPSYSKIKYRHPTNTIIRKGYEHLSVISPLSYEHAEQEGLKYLEGI